VGQGLRLRAEAHLAANEDPGDLALGAQAVDGRGADAQPLGGLGLGEEIGVFGAHEGATVPGPRSCRQDFPLFPPQPSAGVFARCSQREALVAHPRRLSQ
jgi:hypothetical protein